MAEQTETEPCVDGEEEDCPEENGDGVDAKTLANRKKKMKKKEKKNDAAAAVEIIVTDMDGHEQLLEANANETDPSADTGSELITPASSTFPHASPAVGPAASPCLLPAASPSLRPQSSPKHGPDASPLLTPGSKKGEKDKKKAAVVKAARERLEQHCREEEARLALEEEQRRLAEEEERREKEEEEAAQAAKQKQLEAKHEKVAKAKAQGTYMTKGQKAKAAKAALAREQLCGARSPCLGAARSPCLGPTDQKEASANSPQSLLKSVPCVQRSRNNTEESPALRSQCAPDDCFEMLPEAEPDALENEPTLRSPIVCVMGHVDTGKTKLLDKLRSTNVQAREAGGITQQIGATFFPASTLSRQTRVVEPSFHICTPGLLMIDTPGHEAFNNLRTRGSSLCDVAILVVDIMHGLEPQTVESLEMLRQHECPFIIALNKIDMLYSWASMANTSARDALQRQEDHVKDQFHRRVSNIIVELNERGLNACLYWDNDDQGDYISLVPTSAHTGEGMSDLLYSTLARSQSSLSEKLTPKEDVQCTVLEVKNTEGHGTTIDVLLVNGTLHEGDQIVLAGMSGPIVTTIRALLTPQPMKEMRVKGELEHHKSIRAAIGVKISAPGLEKAVCGSDVLVAKASSCMAELQDYVQANFKSVLSGFERQEIGVHVKASTIGSLEALLNFLAKMQVPVSHMSIGEVVKKDVTQAAIMREKKAAEYAAILAFDVKVNSDAKKEAAHVGVQVFTADIIYNLFDKFQAHLEKNGKSNKPLHQPIFPAIVEVVKPSVVHQSDTSLVWCQVTYGHLRLDTPLCFLSEDTEEVIEVGWVREIFKDRSATEIAFVGDRICVKLFQKNPQIEDRDLDRSQQLCSMISRQSNESLKEHFNSEMQRSDWACLDLLNKMLKIDT